MDNRKAYVRYKCQYLHHDIGGTNVRFFPQVTEIEVKPCPKPGKGNHLLCLTLLAPMLFAYFNLKYFLI